MVTFLDLAREAESEAVGETWDGPRELDNVDGCLRAQGLSAMEAGSLGTADNS
jgi:hypothetical protein